jgi:predicted  nucleic acid-binding Zn-ribbon protein
MTDETANIVLAHLRQFGIKLDQVISDIGELKARMSAMEQHLIGIHLDIAGLRSRIDKIEVRLDRIEKRLGLIEA